MSQDELIGKQLDEYRLDSLLGQGGMARVYRAMDIRLKRWVAIKVIDPPFRKDGSYLMRFEREAQAIAQLQHPNIVSIYRYGDVDDLLYMAMQFVEGSALDAVLSSYHDEGELIPLEEARRVIRESCLALDYAHQRGVIHRDIKPANIMLDKQGTVILADFGLVLLEDVGTQGEIFGTPHYIAPEQAISSAGAVPQSDLYAIGVMMYEMFTGVVPFDGSDPLDVAMKHMTDEVPPPRETNPDLSSALEQVILKALAKEPDDRYPTGAALNDALDKALKTKRKSPDHMLDSRLSVVHRVSLGLEDNPLPPLPSTSALPVVEQDSTLPPLPPSTGALPVVEQDSTLPPLPPSTGAMPVVEPDTAKSTDGFPSQPSEPAQPSEPVTPEAKSEPKKPEPASQTAMRQTTEMLNNVPEDKKPLLYAGIGAGVVALIFIFAIMCGTIVMLMGGSDEVATTPDAADNTTASALETPLPDQEIVPTEAEVESSLSDTQPEQPATDEQNPTTETESAVVEESTPEPAVVEEPTPEPTVVEEPTPTPEPEIVLEVLADSYNDFNEAKDGQWRYIWRKDATKGKWEDLNRYSNDHYGDTCFYDKKKKHIRVCDNSVHPGRKEIVAFVWKSNVNGLVQIELVMAKIDRGGNGVDITAHHIFSTGDKNKTDSTVILEYSLGGRATDPINQRILLDNLASGDQLFFVISGDGNSDADHTAFRARVCRPTCPTEDEEGSNFTIE
ncbi:protein kinase [Anaerolineales bacterium HSG24]|nr:protein kinase [Anaerolineales bacterium HSG24]